MNSRCWEKEEKERKKGRPLIFFPQDPVEKFPRAGRQRGGWAVLGVVLCQTKRLQQISCRAGLQNLENRTPTRYF